MLKKIKSIGLLVIALMLIIGLTYKPQTQEFGQAIENKIVLGDGLHPFPGYNMSYAPNYYDANVKEFQTQLNHYSDNTYCGVPDGYFGSKTLTAVKNFQAMEGLTVDGIVGRITWDRIFSN